MILMGVMILREYNLRMLLGNEVVTLQWARKVFEDIYEVSVRYKERGYQTWYMKALATGGFEPISCSMYLSLETMAIKLKEQELMGSTNAE